MHDHLENRLAPARRIPILTCQIASLLGLLLPGMIGAQSPRDQMDRPAVEAMGSTRLQEVVVRNSAPKKSDEQVAAQIEKTRERHAGSVSTVSPEELRVQKPANLGEVIQRVPGAAYIDEDGRGTKPDIGLRGLDPIRSQYVQLLLDGVPIQPSLYSEQAAYYGPAVERIIGIEVFKGGSSILFGPNTVGGVVNLISRPPSLLPFEAVIDTRFDSYGDYSGNIFLSGTVGKLSYGIEYLHKGGDGFRDSLGYSIDDIDLKLAYQFDENNWAQLRLQYYDEQSETPGGLTPKQFRGDVSHSNKPHDEFFGRRLAADLRTTHQLSENQRLELLAYAYRFQRDWFLQDYVSNSTADTTLADSNQQFLREFTTVGFEPRYTLKYDLGATRDNELTIGARVYYDMVNRRTALGFEGDSREGDHVLSSEDELTTFAVAGFIQNEFKVTERFSIVPGVRYEHIEQTREDVFKNADEQSMDYNVWVPGLGLKYEFAPKTLAFANVTRSFRPPSFGDSFNPAIGASSFDLKPSTAWTYEGGLRANPYRWLLAEIGGFYTDFKDQVVVSSGVAGNFNTRSYGFEGLMELGIFGLFHGIQTKEWDNHPDHEIYLTAGATIVDSTFVDGTFEGKDLPYVPRETVTFGIKYSYQDRFDLLFQGRYASDRFTDNANTVEENEPGTVGLMHSYTVFDLKSRWKVSETFALTAGINNIFDETYATQRRTDQQKGVFPGPTRQFYVGATVTF